MPTVLSAPQSSDWGRNSEDLGEVAPEFFHDVVGILRIGDAGQDAGKALLVLRLHPPGDLDPLGLRGACAVQ